MCNWLCQLSLIALASIVNYHHKWCYNLEHHLLTTLGASITIVIHLLYRPLGQDFNYSFGRVFICHAIAYITKRPILKLKTQPKQPLGSLPLAFALPRLVRQLTQLFLFSLKEGTKSPWLNKISDPVGIFMIATTPYFFFEKLFFVAIYVLRGCHQSPLLKRLEGNYTTLGPVL